MKLAIMQPYFFPYLGYFQLIEEVDKFIIYDDVNYINRGWVNRNYILVNNKSSLINIPLSKASQNKNINEIQIVNDYKWKMKLLRTIEFSYKQAPFFSPIYDLIQTQINDVYANIAIFNTQTIKAICEYLGITTKIVYSSVEYQNGNLRGQERILDICKKEYADNYINPIGGVNLYDKKIFQEQRIRLNFIQPSTIAYPQFSEIFVPSLSIIDVLMFCDSTHIKSSLLKKYELV